MQIIRRDFTWFRLLPVVLCTTLILLFAISPAYAATITVNTLSDVVAVDSLCSLREAFANANSGAIHADCVAGSTSSAVTDTIELGVTGTYSLTAGQLSVGFNSRIDLIEASGVEATISAGGLSRLFSLTSSSETVFRVDGITFQDGSATGDGGCVFSSGSGGSYFSFNNGTMRNCNATDQGGAVYVLGVSHGGAFINSTFENNTAGTQGGAVYLNGTAIGYSVDDSTFSQNEAGTEGGAIYATLSGGLALTDSTFSDNFIDNGGALARGGALWLSTQNTLTISGLTVSDNSVSNGTSENKGGGLYLNCGTLNLSGSAFNGNTSSGIGGALAIGAGTPTCSNVVNINVSDTRIENNTATSSGSALYSETNDTQTLRSSCIVGNGDTALFNAGGSSFSADGGGNIANANWWGTSWGPQIVDAGGNSALSPGDSINGDGISPVNVGLSNPNSTPPTGSWLTSAPTVAGAPCASAVLPLPDVTISPSTFNVNEGENANFTITRTGDTASSLVVTVNITRGAGTVAADYTLSGGAITGQNGMRTVTIPMGQGSVNVQIAAAADLIDEANETLTLTLVDEATYNLGATTASTATIVDTTVLTNLTVQLTLQVRPPAPNAAYMVSGEVEVRPTSGGAALIDTTFTADNLGRFTLANVPVGTVDIWVKGSHTLARLHQDFVVSAGGMLTTSLLLEGDANNDGIVSILDFSILATAFGTRVGDADYDVRADFNMDGVVNLIDFSLLASNFAVEGDG